MANSQVTPHAPARQHVPTDQAGADGLIFSIAQIIDHPSVYMSGPSRNAIRIASEIVKHHRADLAAPSAPEVHPSLALESSEMPYRIYTDSSRIWLDDSDGGSLFAYVREGAALSAPAEIEGLVERMTRITRYEHACRNQQILNCDLATISLGDVDDLCAALTAQQADNERLRASRFEVVSERNALQARAERDEARAEAAAAYEKAAQVARNRESHAKGEAARACRGIAVSIGMLATEAETTALDDLVKEAVDGAFKHVVERLKHEIAVNQSLSFNDAIEWVEEVARLDQRKGAGE